LPIALDVDVLSLVNSDRILDERLPASFSLFRLEIFNQMDGARRLHAIVIAQTFGRIAR
jgi:hypothetical protein